MNLTRQLTWHFCLNFGLTNRPLVNERECSQAEDRYAVNSAAADHIPADTMKKISEHQHVDKSDDVVNKPDNADLAGDYASESNAYSDKSSVIHLTKSMSMTSQVLWVGLQTSQLHNSRVFWRLMQCHMNMQQTYLISSLQKKTFNF